MASVSAGVTPLFRVRPARQEAIEVDEDPEILKAAREVRLYCEGVLERAKRLAQRPDVALV